MNKDDIDPIAIMVQAYKESGGETKDLVVDHELAGITMEMLNWFFKNASKYYKLWHPEDHISEENIDSAGANRGPGSIRIAKEKFGDLPVCELRMRAEEPGNTPFNPVYRENIRWASFLSPDDEPFGCATHESKSEDSGIRMRSVFRLPIKTPQWLIDAIRQHNIEEMNRLPVFLPELYRETGKI